MLYFQYCISLVTCLFSLCSIDNDFVEPLPLCQLLIMPEPSSNPFIEENGNPINEYASVESIPPPDYSESSSHTKGRERYKTASDEKESLKQQMHNRHPATAPPPPVYDGTSRNGANSKEKSSMHDRHHHSHHHHHQADHEHRATSSSGKKRAAKILTPKNVDTIDKLDGTGIFGSSFHHDGPFDAVAPHRNKNKRDAPVMAFPVNGPNSSIGGVTTQRNKYDEVFGTSEFTDEGHMAGSRYQGVNTSSADSLAGSSATLDAIRPRFDEVSEVDVTDKAPKVHGPTTAGLGSTTFLDGAPASTNAIERSKSMSLSRTSTSDEKYHKTKEEDSCDSGDDIYLGVPGVKNIERAGSKLINRVKSLSRGRK